MAGQNPVGVEGLAELRRVLKDIGGAPLQKNLRTKFLRVGEEVAADARSTVEVHTGKTRDTIKAGVSGNNAYVKGGGPQSPQFKWLMYGGVLKPTGGRHNTIRRTRVPGGRYIPPAVERKKNRITSAAAEALEQTGRELGLH